VAIFQSGEIVLLRRLDHFRFKPRYGLDFRIEVADCVDAKTDASPCRRWSADTVTSILALRERLAFVLRRSLSWSYRRRSGCFYENVTVAACGRIPGIFNVLGSDSTRYFRGARIDEGGLFP
jgi:hypothetical protein